MNNYIEQDNLKWRLLSDNCSGPCILFITGPFMEDSLNEIYDSVVKSPSAKDFALCEIMVYDWDRFLTPWKANSSFNEREFEGEGKKTIDAIKNEIVPLLKSEYHNITSFYIAGYSLAGLFSLWSLYETEIFDGAISCSGSLWYEGWDKYMENHIINREVKVYLSLGKKEEKTKHPLMKTVGDKTKKQYEMFLRMNSANKVQYDLNEGGHFSDTTKRIVKGLCWLLD